VKRCGDQGHPHRRDAQLYGTDQVLVHRVVIELIDTKRLTDATFAEAIARLGEQAIVELGTIVGYYMAIGNALNAFQVPLPAGAPQPFPD
jgi:4-carboxymuconolactone decarboxylase